MSNQTKSNGLFVLVALIGLFAGINLVNSAWSYYIHKPGEVNIVLPPGAVTVNGTISLPLVFDDVCVGGFKIVKVVLHNTYTQSVDVSVEGVNTTGFSASFDSGPERLTPGETRIVNLMLEVSESVPVGYYDITVDFFVSTV